MTQRIHLRIYLREFLISSILDRTLHPIVRSQHGQATSPFANLTIIKERSIDLLLILYLRHTGLRWSSHRYEQRFAKNHFLDSFWRNRQPHDPALHAKAVAETFSFCLFLLTTFATSTHSPVSLPLRRRIRYQHDLTQR
jgi:hypothetical protein